VVVRASRWLSKYCIEKHHDQKEDVLCRSPNPCREGRCDEARLDKVSAAMRTLRVPHEELHTPSFVGMRYNGDSILCRRMKQPFS
jgi:hypothetical protein